MSGTTVSRTTRTVTAGLLGLGGVLLTAGPARAHVFAEETEVAAGAFSQVTITVPHGCEGSPTTSLAIEVPEGVLSVTPAVHPGWDIEVTTEALDPPVEGSHGEQITERDSVITITAQPGSELPDDRRDSFVIGYQAPETPGEHLFFKTVQTCVDGETAWIEEYTGEGEEPETPSPVVLVTEAEGGHGGGEAEEDEATEVDTETVAETDDDSDPSTGIAIAGLVAGLLGLGLGGVAFARTRQTS